MCRSDYKDSIRSGSCIVTGYTHLRCRNVSPRTPKDGTIQPIHRIVGRLGLVVLQDRNVFVEVLSSTVSYLSVLSLNHPRSPSQCFSLSMKWFFSHHFSLLDTPSFLDVHYPPLPITNSGKTNLSTYCRW